LSAFITGAQVTIFFEEPQENNGQPLAPVT